MRPKLNATHLGAPCERTDLQSECLQTIDCWGLPGLQSDRPAQAKIGQNHARQEGLRLAINLGQVLGLSVQRRKRFYVLLPALHLFFIR